MEKIKEMDNTFLSKIKDKEKRLSPNQKFYWDIIKSNGAVLFVQGPAGTGKSAMFSNLAEILGMNYIDLRLATLDETDLGTYPSKEPYIGADGLSHNYVEHLPPHWAILSNDRPTLIHMEELNRTNSITKRNAALQILNEKAIGHNFKFNENVFFVGSGNLGVEDGNEVDEFDNALINRLCIIEHRLTVQEWVDFYAIPNNIHPIIISMLLNHTEHFNNPTKTYNITESKDIQSQCFPSPRSWTNLDKFIRVNNIDLTDNADLDKLNRVSNGTIGKVSTIFFIQYIRDSIKINFNTILDDFEACQKDIKKMDRPKISSLINDMRINLLEKTGVGYKTKIFNLDFPESKFQNLVNFLKLAQQDRKRNGAIEHGCEDEVSNILSEFITAAPPEICINMNGEYDMEYNRFKMMQSGDPVLSGLVNKGRKIKYENDVKG
jgi:hypothetical protein